MFSGCSTVFVGGRKEKLKLPAYRVCQALSCFFIGVPAIPQHRRVIGDNVRTYRKAAGWSQEKLAEKADLHPVYISQVERAERAITIDSLLRITKAMGIKLRDVVGEL